MEVETDGIERKLQDQLRQGFVKQLELLAADLIGYALDVPIFVSKSGFQHGAMQAQLDKRSSPANRLPRFVSVGGGPNNCRP